MQLRLAISLHGASDEIRNRIMPVNRKYPLKELIAACLHYQKLKGRMITFEYILIAEVNDSLDQVTPLAQLSRQLHAKVNLIPLNPAPEIPFSPPSPEAVDAFCGILATSKLTVSVRRPRGQDILAACGQLHLRAEDRRPSKRPRPERPRPNRQGARSRGGRAAR